MLRHSSPDPLPAIEVGDVGTSAATTNGAGRQLPIRATVIAYDTTTFVRTLIVLKSYRPNHHQPCLAWNGVGVRHPACQTPSISSGNTTSSSRYRFKRSPRSLGIQTSFRFLWTMHILRYVLCSNKRLIAALMKTLERSIYPKCAVCRPPRLQRGNSHHPGLP